MKQSLSIIFPIYNEQNRIEKSFLDIEKFIETNTIFDLEIIFVNDGSNDETDYKIKDFIKKKNSDLYQYFYSKNNMGKGHALKRGVQIAKNDWVLTSDADCSVSNFQLTEWIAKKYIKKNIFIYFGSRNHQSSIVKKKIIRKMVGIVFKLLIRLFFKIKISDTQCGFKLIDTFEVSS